MTEKNREIARRFASVVFVVVLNGLLLFAAAGTLAWPRAWLYLGTSFALLLCNGVVLLRVNPEVIVARARQRAGTKPFDRTFALVFGVGVLALPVLAGLDGARWGGPAYGTALMAVGLALMVVGDGIMVWAMAVNRHLEQTVRIQTDRGHVVVDTGPYRLVRHPMYVGMLLQYAGAPLVLGSVWAWPAVGLLGVSLVVRTALEDRTLRDELEGYEAFTKKTRARLIPGVW